MDKKITIQDVAELAGVSKSTVSRYLNHGYISPEKTERVRAAISETGFKTNFFAKRLKTKRSQLIGVVLPRMDSVSVGKLLAGMSRALEPAGYQGFMLVSQLSVEKELMSIRSLIQQGVDGIIVDSVAITEEHLQIVEGAGIPIVFTGQQHPGLDCVKIDDYAAGRMMGAYLRQLGHRRAVFAGVTETDAAVGGDRRRGFQEAFLEAEEARVDFLQTGFGFLAAYNRAADILKLQPTVVACATDNISLGLLRYFHEMHIKVPEEISVTGFGGYDVGAVVYPALTSVFFDYELVGMKAASRLLRRLEGADEELDMEIPLFFIDRESVRAL